MGQCGYPNINVGYTTYPITWIKQCHKPSPSHHHFCRRFLNHSQSLLVYDIVLPTLENMVMCGGLTWFNHERFQVLSDLYNGIEWMKQHGHWTAYKLELSPCSNCKSWYIIKDICHFPYECHVRLAGGYRFIFNSIWDCNSNWLILETTNQTCAAVLILYCLAACSSWIWLISSPWNKSNVRWFIKLGH